MAGRGSEAHFLLLPYIELGHITPMLSLASQLVALGCRVTFVSRAQNQEVAEDQGSAVEAGEGVAERLRFVTMPVAEDLESMQSEIGEGIQAFKKTLGGLEERQGRLVARLLRESLASSHPISCIISDFFMWKWVSPLARSLGLPLAILNVCSAITFYTLHLQQKGNYSEIEDLLVSGFGLPTSRFDDGLSSLGNAPHEVKEETTNVFHTLFEGIDEAGHIVFVHSFQHLEAPLLPFLEASPLDFRFFGPCLPTWSRDHVGVGNIMARRAGSAFSEEHACLPWLDKQEKGSVLFVSFGSQATLRAEEQMEELAMGIEKSGVKFLWVVRPDAVAGTQLPEALRERINSGDGERGMFVPWVPQKRVLEHPAVGGFLTHSGWNSTVESVTCGVPMLCLPFFGDQPLTANMVEGYWKVGLRLGPSKAGVVAREEVERGVRSIFLQGHPCTSGVAHYQQAAQSAIEDVHHTLASFVQGIAALN